jgi:hypothetical protein
LGSVQGAMVTSSGTGSSCSGAIGARWSAGACSSALELYPRLLLGRFDAARPNWWRTAESSLDREHALWGGESAAHILGLDLRPSRILV